MSRKKAITASLTALLFILILSACGNTYVYPPTFVYQNARYMEDGSKADKIPEGYTSKGKLIDNAKKICDWSGKPGEEKYGNWELFVSAKDSQQDIWLKDPDTGDYILWHFERSEQ